MKELEQALANIDYAISMLSLKRAEHAQLIKDLELIKKELDAKNSGSRD